MLENTPMLPDLVATFEKAAATATVVFSIGIKNCFSRKVVDANVQRSEATPKRPKKKVALFDVMQNWLPFRVHNSELAVHC